MKEKYIYSPSLHQVLYQKLIKCFSTYIPNHIIQNIPNEENLDVISNEIVIYEDFQKSTTEKETYESIEKLKYAQKNG